MKKLSKNIIFIIVVVFSLIFLSFAGCKSTTTEQTAAETTVSATTQVAEITATETTTATVEKKKLKFGFSNASLSNPWRVNMYETMQYEIERIGNIELITTDAKDDAAKQMSDCEDLLSQDIDALLISPAVTGALAPVVPKSHEKGIPVIVIDRDIGSSDYDAFVYTDGKIIGKAIGGYIAEKYNGKADIIYITGIPGAGPDTERTEGLKSVFVDYPDLKILAEQAGNWNDADSMTAMENLLQAHSDFDIVITSDGTEGLGVLRALKAANRTGVEVVCMDASRNDSFKNIKDGVIAPFTAINPTYCGGWAVKVAVDILNGKKPTDPNNICMVPSAIIDQSNVDKYYDSNLDLTAYSWEQLYNDELARVYDSQMQ